ncbi:MAG TPA: M4 family metallopeptidase [Mycobacteriales bacterium]|nr:M4 family metallopeptidase [Mycobacteriales bacterium]
MRSRYVMFWGAATALGLSTATLVAASPASAAPPKPTSRSAAVAELKASSDRTPSVTTDRSGVVRSVRTTPGHPIDRPTGVRRGASAEFSARGLAKEHGAAFGLTGGGTELRTTATLPAAGGLEVVRFNQTMNDVPVLGADFVVTVRPDGETVSVGSTVTTATPATTTPKVTARQAAATARAVTLRTESLSKDAALTVGTPELAMFDPAVFGAPGRPGVRPVWRTKVTGTSRSGPLAADVLVDARANRVVLYANALHTALSRQVCDHKQVRVGSPPGTVDGPGYYCPANRAFGAKVPYGVVAAVEGRFGTDTDVKNAYRFAATTHFFYKKLFNRDSIDGNGMQIRSSVRFCPPDGGSGASCYRNAAWDGEQMVYGPGFASGDDVVAHELTHGVTQHTSNLYYWYQSGSINESMSDVFGEFVDLTDGTDGRGRQTAWEMGEDVPGGAIRSMSNPAKFGDPATMTASQYRGDYDDSGGVHSNSGVGNRAAYLIATGLGGGGTGISKAAQIYYLTLQNLSSGADYADLARTLQASCAALAGQTFPAVKAASSDPATVTFAAGDCAAVDSAIAATQMTTGPTRPNAAAPEAPRCPDGAAPATTLFSDDMENPNSGNWTLTTPADPNDATTAYYRAETSDGSSYAHSGQTSLIGMSSEIWTSSETEAPGPAAAGRAQTTSSIAIPASGRTFLWFAHSDRLLDGGAGSGTDGGRVLAAYTTAGIPTTVDLGADGVGANGYNDLARDGERAFSGDSHGYVSSRFEVTSLAGRAIKPTFDLVGDTAGYSDWYLDDVEVYTCAGPTPGKVTGVQAAPATATAVTLGWNAPDWAGDSGLRDYTVDVAPAVPGFPKTVTGDTTSVTGLAETTAYRFTVTANAVDGTAGAPTGTDVVPTAATLKSSASTVVYGQRATLSGTVTRPGTATGVGAVTVLVERRPPHTADWTRVATARSVSTGAWAVPVLPTRGYEYQATPQAGPGAWAGTASADITQKVAWKINASFVTATIKRGQTAQMRVSLSPGRYAQLELQRRVGTRWVVIQRKKSTSKGTAVLTVKHTKAGRFAYRVVARGDAYLVITGSAARGLIVK